VLEQKGKKVDSSDYKRKESDEEIFVEDNVTFDTKNIIEQKIKPAWMDEDIWEDISRDKKDKRARSFFSNKVHKIINKQIGNIWEV